MSEITTAQRAALVANAKWLVGWNEQIGYDTDRPFHLKTKAELVTLFSAGEDVSGDCSWSLTELFFMTGLKDPTGFNFNGDGNTESMLTHLTKRYANPAGAKAGAIVIFGVGLPLNEQHGAMVIKPDKKNPTLFSHGSAAGPIEIPFVQEQAAHFGSTVFLSVVDL